jgi:hypothetical protein
MTADHVDAKPEPEILVCAQNEWYTEPVSCGAQAGVDTVITIGGSFWLSIGAPDTPDLTAFLTKTLAEVKARIRRFLRAHPAVERRTPAIVIMDIEKPHPKDLHEHPVRTQNRLIEAFKLRAAAAREMLPNAKLGFYGTLVPDARGRADYPTFKARLAALARAGERGMFDQVDYLVPVVYPRFGPRDAAWNTYAEYTRLGIVGSRHLHRSDGTELPLAPLLTYSVANGNSEHHRQLLMDLPTSEPLHETLRVQLEVMAAERVRTSVFWVGENSDLITRLPNPNGRTVTQHICGR